PRAVIRTATGYLEVRHMTVSQPSRDEQELLEAISTERLMTSTETIAQWVRLSGTPEEAASFDWIEQQLNEYGLQVERFSHPALVSWPVSASLEVVGADGQRETFTCATHAFAT